MPTRRAWFGLLVSACALVVAATAAAQPAGGSVLARELRFAAAHGVRLQTDDLGGGRVRVSLAALGPAQAPLGPSVLVHEGADARSALAVREGAALVALVRGGASTFVRFAVVALDADGAPAGTPKALDATALRTGRDGVPTAVLACPDPTGFTVLWQELVLAGDRPDARTYFGRIGADGRWLEPAHVVDVPWSVAALAHDGRGYHLGLYFTSSSPEQTRVSLVTLDPGGRPEQHPWWASRPELVSEVQLAVAGGRVLAYWRGGADGTSLRSSDVTDVGQWGTEPGPAQEHGTLPLEASFALRVDAGREVVVVRSGP
ncbi:MAG: hypothetical protein IT373_31240 [Polyangiaceae bacterium]|nr:hypothetical protein [Polyangiaceae bacterium]